MAFLYQAFATLGAAALIAGAFGALLWRPVIRPALIRWALDQTKQPPRFAVRRAR